MALLDDEQLKSLSPFFGTGFGRFSAKVMKKALALDDFIGCYERSAAGGTTGPDFARNVCLDSGAVYEVAGLEKLAAFKEGPFITISNHPYGGMDGIILVDVLGHFRSGYKVVVNKFIAILEAISCNFITVIPTGKKRTAANAQSIQGIKMMLRQLAEGHPVGMFPAGAVSNLKPFHGIHDRPWQDAMIRVIQKAGVPVIPIRFFDGNTKFFYRLGLVSHTLRVMRLPKEVINKRGRQIRLAIGDPIPVEKQKEFKSVQEFSDFLRHSVYDMELPPKEAFVSRDDVKYD